MDTSLLTLLVIGLIVFAIYLYNRILELQKSLSELEERLSYREQDEALIASAHATQHPVERPVPPLEAAPPSVVTPPSTPVFQPAPAPAVAYTTPSVQPVYSPPPMPPLPVFEPKPSPSPQTAPAAATGDTQQRPAWSIEEAEAFTLKLTPEPLAPQRPAWNIRDVEALVGGNWLAKLGVIAIAIAMAFFLQYAFSKGLISPTMQVVAGLSVSALMIGAGQYLLTKQTYRNYAQVVISGGIMVYFLSIYAAYNFYNPHLIGYTIAFAALAIGALAASALALKNDTEAVALLCTLGAFAAPILIRSNGVASSSAPYSLYAYLTFLNLWVFALVRLRNWTSLSAIGLASTWILFFGAGSYEGQGWITEGVATIFLLFSCYQGIQMLTAYAESTEQSDDTVMPIAVKLGLGMILVGCLAFGVSSAAILLHVNTLGFPDVALAGLTLTLVMVWLTTSLPRIGRYEKEMRLLFGYLASGAFLTLMSVALKTATPISQANAPSAFVFSVTTYFLFLGVSTTLFRRSEATATAALLVISNAFVHIWMTSLALQSVALWKVPAHILWLPLAGWLGILGLWSVAKLANEREYFTRTLVFIAHSLPLIGLLIALNTGRSPIGAGLFAGEFVLISGTWIALRKQTAWRWFRADIFAIFSNAVLFFGYFTVYAPSETYHGAVPLAAWALAMAVYHALVGGFALRKTGADLLDRLLYLGIGATFLAVAISLQLKGSFITLSWATEAAALILAGLAARNATVRAYGLTLFAIAVAKSFLLDTTIPLESTTLFWNPRFLSGVAVVASAYLSAFAYWKKRTETLPAEQDVIWSLCLTAHLFTLLFVSLDLWGYARTAGANDIQPSVAQCALSVFWAVYACAIIALGCSRGWARLRWLGLGVFALAALKTAVVDLLIPPTHFALFYNPRFLSGLAVIVSAYLSAFAYWKKRTETLPSEKSAVWGLCLTAHLFTLLFVSLDLWNSAGGTNDLQQSLAQCTQSLFWALYASVTLWLGCSRRWQSLRQLGVGILVLTTVKIVFMDLWIPPTHFALLYNVRILTGFVVVLATYFTAWLVEKYKQDIPAEERRYLRGFLLSAHLLTLLFVSRDLWEQAQLHWNAGGQGNAPQLAMSIFWTVYALTAVIFGIVKRNRQTRLFAMGLLYFSVLKVFVFDLSGLEGIYRIASFFTLGVILLLVSLLYTRFEAQMRSEASSQTERA